MITGHLGIAAALRSGWRDASFLWMLPASVAPDALDVLLAACGICNPYGLYSHTVHAAALMAAVFGGIAFLATDSRATGLACAALVMLHLPPDLITGHKIFWPGGDLIGLALHYRPRLDFIIEVPIALAGWWLLRRQPHAPRWAITWPAATLLVVLQGFFLLASLDRGVKPNACKPAKWEVELSRSVVQSLSRRVSDRLTD